MTWEDQKRTYRYLAWEETQILNDAFIFINNAPNSLTICDLILEAINESGSRSAWFKAFQKAALLLQYPAVPLLRVVHQVNHSAMEGYWASASQKWHSPASLFTSSREASLVPEAEFRKEAQRSNPRDTVRWQMALCNAFQSPLSIPFHPVDSWR